MTLRRNSMKNLRIYIADLSEESPSTNIELIISKRLSRLGMPSGLSGYRYMTSAIKTVLYNENALDSITKILYPDVAKIHNTTPQRVEKAMRHAIKVTWGSGSFSNIDGYTFYVREGRNYPTNSHFIAEVSRHIKMFNLL